MESKSRMVPVVLAAGLALTGGGAVFAAAGGSSGGGSSAKEQYCPPSSPQAGQPQGGPGNNCGNPNPGTPGGPPDRPPNKGNKPPKFKVLAMSPRRCYSRTMKLKVTAPSSGGKTVVYRDGRKVKTSGKKSFTIVLDVSGLKRGAHTLKLRHKDADGNITTHTMRFRRC